MNRTLLASASVAALCLAQTATAAHMHPTDTSALLVDSIRVHVTLGWTDGDDKGPDFELGATEKEVDIEHTILLWATGSGIELVGDPASTAAHIDGDTSGRPLPRDMFAALSDAAVDSAIARGHLTSAQTIVRVLQARAVEETAQGNELTYDDCGNGDYAAREYGIVWGTAPDATLIGEDACGSAVPSYCACTAAP